MEDNNDILAHTVTALVQVIGELEDIDWVLERVTP
jgi:hypothetical protein